MGTSVNRRTRLSDPGPAGCTNTAAAGASFSNRVDDVPVAPGTTVVITTGNGFVTLHAPPFISECEIHNVATVATKRTVAAFAARAFRRDVFFEWTSIGERKIAAAPHAAPVTAPYACSPPPASRPTSDRPVIPNRSETSVTTTGDATYRGTASASAIFASDGNRNPSSPPPPPVAVGLARFRPRNTSKTRNPPRKTAKTAKTYAPPRPLRTAYPARKKNVDATPANVAHDAAASEPPTHPSARR
jgi:hypothetical protein